MYRIIQYGNSNYAVQKRGRYGWFRIGETYLRRTSAERCIERDKQQWAPFTVSRVVAYR